VPIDYKGVQVARAYVVDLLIERSLVVEIKSVDQLLPIHSAQLLTYLRLQQVSSGLLINFNVAMLARGIRRLLL
jgi:GxxExxY protein